ncbi:MAG: hypothetical protein ACI8XC_003364 [Gammaproteobacteria bacterium]
MHRTTRLNTNNSIDPNAITRSIENWVNKMVIGYQLCPFAANEWRNGRVRISVSQAETSNELLQHLRDEIERIIKNENIETTLVVHPYVLTEFDDFNDFLDLTDQLVETLHLNGVLQWASFHPDYQFANSEPTDPENYTNRSPYPVLQILREESLSRAIDRHPDIDQVPIDNMELMREIGCEKLEIILKECIR